MPGNPDTRRLIGESLDHGWQLFRKCLPMLFLPLWAANFVNALPGVLASGGLLAATFSRRDILVTIVSWLVESLLYGFTIARLDANVRSVRIPAKQMWRIAGGAVPAILIGDLVYNIAAWCGLLLFIVPGIILGTTLVFFAFAAVIDRKNVLDALAYSHALTWPDWWRTSVVISVPAIVLFLYSVVAGWPAIMGAVHAFAEGRIPGMAAVSHPWYDLGLMPLLGGLVWSYVLAVLYVQYAALKARAAVH